jgi:hypothetical protein
MTSPHQEECRHHFATSNRPQRRLQLIASIVVFAAATSGAFAQTDPPAVPIGSPIRASISVQYTVEELASLISGHAEVEDVAMGPSTATVRLRSGAVVVVPRPGRTLSGTLVGVTSTAIVIRLPRGVSMTAPRAAIRRLEVATGHRSRARGALYGILLGAPLGALAGFVAEGDCNPHSLGCWPEIAALAGGAIGAVGGAVTGALIPPARRWTAIDVSTLSLASTAERSERAGAEPPGPFAADLGMSYAVSGPSAAFEDAMRRAGLDDTSPPSWFTSRQTPHPFSSHGLATGGWPVSIGAGYRVRGTAWSVEAFWRRTPLGETSGFKLPGQFLVLEYGIDAASVVAWRAWGPVQIGAGPARYTLRTRQLTSGGDTQWTGSDSWGWTAGGAIRVPVDSRLHLRARIDYHRVGRVAVGPFPTDLLMPETVFPQQAIDMNHWSLSFGPGVRF